MSELDERKRKILKAIIKTYLETGEPVGSRTISKDTDLNLSSATIRNEMSDLEEMGYIIQPHTSAGRIPSDAGYRLYVDELMEEKKQEYTILPTDRREQAKRLVNNVRQAIEELNAFVADNRFLGKGISSSDDDRRCLCWIDGNGDFHEETENYEFI